MKSADLGWITHVGNHAEADQKHDDACDPSKNLPMPFPVHEFREHVGDRSNKALDANELMKEKRWIELWKQAVEREMDKSESEEHEATTIEMLTNFPWVLRNTCCNDFSSLKITLQGKLAKGWSLTTLLTCK